MLTLSPTEASALLRLLETSIPQLRVEIHRTEWNHQLREDLEADERSLSSLRQRLTAFVEPQLPA